VFQANTAMLDRSARQRLQAHAKPRRCASSYFMDAYQYGNGFARLVQALKARGGADLRRADRQARASLAGNRM
jgi:methyl-accepting chemotaxis protein